MIIFPPCISTLPEHEALKDKHPHQEISIGPLNVASADILEAVADFIRLVDKTHCVLQEFREEDPDLYKLAFWTNDLCVETYGDLQMLRHLAADIIALACEQAGILGIPFRGQLTKYDDPNHTLNAVVAQFYLELPVFFEKVQWDIRSAGYGNSITDQQKEVLKRYTDKFEETLRHCHVKFEELKEAVPLYKNLEPLQEKADCRSTTTEAPYHSYPLR